MKNLACILIGLFFLSSCGQSSNSNTENSTTENEKEQETLNQQTEMINDDSYKIISEIKNVNPEFDINKCNIEIELKEKISKEKLILIANNLRKTRTTYDYVWIFYYLPGVKVGAGAWAYTHFTPNLEVEILGTTADEEAKQKENAGNVDGKIIGKFYEQQYTDGTYTVYEKNNKTFIKVVYGDGSSDDEEMKKSTVSNGTRFDYKDGSGNVRGYRILTKSGILEFYNAENKKFTTAIKTE